MIKAIQTEEISMPRVFRHDAVTLSSGVKEEDFEKFMTEELVPFFSEQYKGPTRVSIADIKGQSLFKSAQTPREYLWITEWEGSPESVRGSSFAQSALRADSENLRPVLRDRLVARWRRTCPV